MTEEIWKDIVGYEGKYMISDIGRVKSLNYHMTGEERILKPGKNTDGYLQVRLSKNNEGKLFTVHRLVALAFIENPDSNEEIDHINTIRDDNRVDNLRWTTHKENCCNPISRKRYQDSAPLAGKFGKDNCFSKAVYQYSIDGKLIREWYAARDVQRELGFDHSNISKCCRGEQKTAYNFVWKYA